MSEPKTARDVLVAARELLSDEKRWGKGHDASDSYGNSVSPYEQSACRWCSYGAIDWARGSIEDDIDGAEAVLTGVLPPGFGGVATFNDAKSTTHADVLSAFDRAIASLEPLQ